MRSWLKVLRGTPELWIFGLLLVLAGVSGPRLDDDSYSHYARSSRQILGLDWSAWITDVWNKPLPGLAYGLGSVLGLWGARAVACAFTAGTAYFTRKLLVALLPGSPMVGVAASLFFFAQPALFKDAFVTMTELPAAMFVAWALVALYVEGRPRKAALLAGLVPLCRVEMLPVVVVTALYCGLEDKRTSRDASIREQWLRLLVTAGAAGLPFAIWWAAGFATTADLQWFSRASYAYIRTNWELPALLRYNVFTGLVNVIPPPLLLVFIYGLFAWWRRAWQMRPNVMGHLLLLLAVHYFLLNTLVVYPKDWFGVAPGHGVAAINGRNYSSSAPALVALSVLGLANEFRAQSSSASRRRRLGGLGAAAIASAALIYFSKGSNIADLGLHLGLLVVGLGLASWLISSSARPGNDRVGFSRPLKLIGLAGFIGAIIVRPFFWYPTLGADQRATAIGALAQRIAIERPSRVIQDTASFLEVAASELGLDISATETEWTWPGEYPRRLSQSAADTWVVLELNPRGESLARYPSAIMDQIQSGELQPIGEYRTTPHQGLLAILDRVSARNSAIGWRVFRLRSQTSVELAPAR